MKFLNALGLFLVAYFLQTGLFSHLHIFGVAPNLVLCLVIVLSFFYDEYYGVGLGILFAMLLDIGYGPIIGIGSLSVYIVYWAILFIREILYRDNILSVLFISIIGTGLYYLLYWGLSAIFIESYHILYMLKPLPIFITLHGLICLVFYFVIRKSLVKHPGDRFV